MNPAIIQSIFDTQFQFNSQEWEHNAIFDSSNLTKEKLSNFFASEREITTVNQYSLQNWKDLLSADPVAILFDNVPMKIINKDAFINKGKEYFDTDSRVYRFDCTEKKIHRYIEEEFKQLNLLNNKNNTLDHQLKHLQSNKTNIFYGSKSTQMGLHIDANGSIGYILNSTGLKLFLFANYQEVVGNFEEILLPDGRIRIDVFQQKIESYRWVILKPNQYLYWPGYSYHAVFNIESSVFVSPTYIPNLYPTAQVWLNYVLSNLKHKFTTRKSVKSALCRLLKKRKFGEYASDNV
jgi:hypothetical protein